MLYDMKIDLSDKIAVVTGSTGELGRIMARSLAKCGGKYWSLLLQQ
jgi:3-oxoacyl-[acyl-carrier protein] reductase